MASGNRICKSWMTLSAVIVLIGLISVGQGYKQEVWLPFEEGNALVFDTNTPDLEKYRSLLNDAWEICVKGVWSFHMTTNYSSAYYSYGEADPNFHCYNAGASVWRSIRHLGANDTSTNALSLYTLEKYAGEEIFITGRAYTGIQNQIGTFAATGGILDWMFFEGKQLDGKSFCFNHVASQTIIHGNINSTSLTTIGSVFQGCDLQEIQAYKVLHNVF